MNKNKVFNFFKDYPYRTVNYFKNDIIAFEGDICTHIGLVLEGKVDIKRILSSNKVVHLSSFEKGDLFGEVIAFSDTNKYPATVISSSDSKVMFISKDDFINFCITHPEFLSMFLNVLTNKVMTLNNSITNLSLSSIRQKIANYLITEFRYQNSLFIKLDITKQKLSEKLGVPRPSLSRELINMKNDNIIDYDKNIIKILDMDELENILMQ